MEYHKKIPLTQGKVALVDIEDYEWLNQWKWQAHKNTKGFFYVAGRNKKQKFQSMHRKIMKAPKGMEVDHINGDGLDNRRNNLRTCSHSQNIMNSKMRIDNTNGYKGIRYHKQNKKWQARIKKNKKDNHLGYFTTPQEAALAYNEAAKKFFGEFAKLNVI